MTNKITQLIGDGKGGFKVRCAACSRAFKPKTRDGRTYPSAHKRGDVSCPGAALDARTITVSSPAECEAVYAKQCARRAAEIARDEENSAWLRARESLKVGDRVTRRGMNTVHTIRAICGTIAELSPHGYGFSLSDLNKA